MGVLRQRAPASSEPGDAFRAAGGLATSILPWAVDKKLLSVFRFFADRSAPSWQYAEIPGLLRHKLEPKGQLDHQGDGVAPASCAGW